MLTRVLLTAALALGALALPAAASADDYVPGEVIVHYEDGSSGAAADSLQDATGTVTEQALPGGSDQLAIEDGDSVKQTIAELESDPDVAYAVPNWRAHAAAAAVTSDPGSRRQWNLFGDFGINLLEAWSLAESRGAPGGRGAVVAVLDSGVAYESRGRYRRAPDLRKSTFVKPYDFIDDDRHPNDSFGHGTHVSGTIAQTTNNGVATAGIAYNAKIMPLRVLDASGTGDSAAIARAIRYAARHGADVINLSLEFPAQVRAAEIPDVISSLRYARSKGAVVVAAAGNQADYAVAYPARVSSVIAVGATTITGCQADYSNSGSHLDLVAPGGGVDAPNEDSVWDTQHCNPDSFGKPIFQQTFLHERNIRRFGLPGGYEGTSMAAPHVAAVTALIIATKRLGPNPTQRQVEAHLKATAKHTDRPDRYGAGLLDAGAALR
ncbi:MAG TPA: S8 family serine peptidase [Thermoleophilaceae bacterium]|jgi:serine protease|nr:S8 family serine peptidase [Thermoleophilaceae bacterium]